jgi:hypothetical protein
MRALGLTLGLLLAAACGAGPTGGGSLPADGAQFFYGMADGEVVFVVLRAPWAFAGESMAARSKDPGADRVAVSWLAADGAAVHVDATVVGPGAGTIRFDGVQFDLADGNVFALRRTQGRTEVQVVARRELDREGLEGSVGKVLAEHPEIREYLGLDDAPPVRVSVSGRSAEGPPELLGIEITNVGDRPVAGVSIRAFELGPGGQPVGPAGHQSTWAFPDDAHLLPGESRKDTIPVDPAATNAHVLVTRIVFAAGQPPVWLAD